MSDKSKLGLHDAARRLGVSTRTLRQAIRAGRIPAPPHLSATAILPPEWFDSVTAAIDASPGALSHMVPPKVPDFARYRGTSAWHKYPRRVREYARFRARASQAEQAAQA